LAVKDLESVLKEQTPQGPITILIAALGGEGGGVLSNWIVDAATAQDFPVQSTSIPGVAQRTGATTYYVEIHPQRRTELGGRRPVLALTPSPGNIDVMVASELLEAARAMQNGYVSPRRTTLIASTHRIYAIAEKAAMADGRFDAERIHRAASTLAKKALLFDMAELAAQSGTVISAVMFGAIAGSGALPLTREACEQAIRRAGKGAEASLRGFAAGWDCASGKASPATDSRKRSEPAPHARARRDFPPQTLRIVEQGVARVTDYQDSRYADAYLDWLSSVLALEQKSRAAAGFPLTNEVARQLALWMSYEDIIRVADLKTRRSRFDRVRQEVRARPHEPVRIVEFLKPGIEELCAVLPSVIARPLLGWAHRRGRSFNFALHLRTSSVSGYLLLRSMAWLRPLRRRTSRFREEQALIERWLAAIRAAAERDHALALEIARCAQLLKGYGDTHARGLGNFLRIFEELIDGAPELDSTQRAVAIREARQAALSSPEGKKPESAPSAVRAQPVVWVSPKRAEVLSENADK
jgi:indolepyruvate ferredoxin oxidoreductase, beta subunit